MFNFGWYEANLADAAICRTSSANEDLLPPRLSDAHCRFGRFNRAFAPRAGSGKLFELTGAWSQK